MLLSLAELLAMTVWFSASAVSPVLQTEWGLSNGQIAWLVMAVQLGFVAGTLLIAVTNLADVFSARLVVSASALGAALVNALFPVASESFALALLLRFATGAFLAGVYPPGMKILAGWFKEKRGLAIGVMVGALAIGSASPHLVGSLLRAQWQLSIFVSSAFCLLSAVIVYFFVHDGPYNVAARTFNFKYILTVLRDRPVRLAYFGYFGHMWEVYAMWTWVPVFLLTRMGNPVNAKWSAGFWSFLVLAAGALGCVGYGYWSDKVGRSLSTISAMAVSGLCCLLIGLVPANHTSLVLAVCLIWGVTVVADSAQFSAAASELCDPRYMGTVLTLQTSIGFLLTMISIRLVPLIQDVAGWGLAFGILALGPVAGIGAMARLRKLPEARKMAGGNR